MVLSNDLGRDSRLPALLSAPRPLSLPLRREVAKVSAPISNRVRLMAFDDVFTALKELVACNERWNEAVQAIVERPPEWNDAYLDRAREVIAQVENPRFVVKAEKP